MHVMNSIASEWIRNLPRMWLSAALLNLNMMMSTARLLVRAGYHDMHQLRLLDVLDSADIFHACI
jgi:hypothetical protein